MNYIIVADIRGVRYYVWARTANWGGLIDYKYEGLKNNASVFDDEERAKEVAWKIKALDEWELKVESY